MQPIDALTLFHLAGEWDAKLSGAKINKIQQANRYAFLFQLWTGGDQGRRKFYINLHPEMTFCGLLEETSFLVFPQRAFSLCMLLRKHLVGARVERVESVPDERVLKIKLENYNEMGQHVHFVLVLELSGRLNNLILLDGDKTILGCMQIVVDEDNPKRIIKTGSLYRLPDPPPGRSGIRFENANVIRESLQRASLQALDPVDTILEQFYGIGRAVLGQIFTGRDSSVAVQRLEEVLQGIHLCPGLRKDGQAWSLVIPSAEDKDNWVEKPSLNAMIADYYSMHLSTLTVEKAKRQMMRILKREKEKLKKQQKALLAVQPEKTDALKKTGDLLMQAASQSEKPGACSVTVMDYELGQEVVLAVDPAVSIRENARRSYKRYKKAVGQAARFNDEKEAYAQKEQFLEDLTQMVARIDTVQEADIVTQDFISQGWLKSLETGKSTGKTKKEAVMSIQSSDGFLVLIGRSSLQNELIVGKRSRGEDVWVHAWGMPGSHVLIKAEKQDIPDQTLYEAALLAAWFSAGRNSVNVPVIYTKAQYVRKIPGSYPGHVTYSRESELRVTPQPADIERLLERRTE